MNRNMTFGQFNDKTVEMEAEIRDILQRFSEDTGVEVERVTLSVYMDENDVKKYKVKTKGKISVDRGEDDE